LLWIAIGDGLDAPREHLGPGHPQRRGNIADGDRPRGKADNLIEIRLGVSHRSLAGTGDLVKGIVLDLDALRIGDQLEAVVDLLPRDRAEEELLTARANSFGNLLQLGCRHNEDDVRRRLFERFQQGIEGMARQLMDLIDDENLKAVAGGRDVDALKNDVADLFDL